MIKKFYVFSLQIYA